MRLQNKEFRDLYE